jgi:hypothetical protein
MASSVARRVVSNAAASVGSVPALVGLSIGVVVVLSVMGSPGVSHERTIRSPKRF